MENAQYVDYHLYRAMRKYGTKHFHIELIENVEDELLAEREQYWIKFYDSFANGYNMTMGGEGNRLYDKVKIYSLWDKGLSISQIAELVGCVKSVIYECLLDYDNYSVTESLHRRAENKKKRVCQFDTEGKLLNIFDSEQDACIAVDAAHGAIGNCCNNFDKYKTARGYIWLWEEQQCLIEERVRQLKQSRRSIPKMQQVVQLDNYNHIIAIFPSAKEAAKHFGKKKDSHIGDCCKGRRESCFGYKWKFYSDI